MQPPDTNPDHNENNTRAPGENDSCDRCETPAGGPVREAGGTTGEGNLSPNQASRTGGATGGVDA
jgi:hypothetical protein